MVSELQQKKTQQIHFPETAPAASPVFFRTYSRKDKQERETWEQVCDRSIQGLKELGSLNAQETELLYRMMYPLKSLPSGRWLWVGGTDWIKQEQNFSGAYNCTSTNVIDWEAFGLMMDLAMQGCGTGGVLEPKYIDKLPVITNKLEISIEGELGSTPIAERRELTSVKILGDKVYINVGDSRQGWVKSYQSLLEISSDTRFNGLVEVIINLSDVRPAGEPLKGFGGVANPVKLTDLYYRCSRILNAAVGRKLNSVECCLLIDEAAVTIVAGNIRRCIPNGALVYSESGLVPIEKIRIGDRVLTSKGFYPVTNFFDQGVQSLCRIKTQDSYFDCTPDHKVAVLEDVYGKYRMIEAKYLTEGDRLVFLPQSIPGTATELPEFKDKLVSYAKKITIPALTSDIAYFIGYLHGDGSVGSDGSRVRFRISEDQQQIIDKLVNVGQLFGLNTYTLRTPEQCKAKAFELQFNSTALNRYLSQFKQAFSSIRIPDCILLGTKNIREAYLAGLADADGCFSQPILVASVYPDFLRQVQAIYGSLGITTRLCESIRKRTGKWEGELVTVGEAAFEQTLTLFSVYSLRFAHNNRSRPKSFKDHGFPKEMVKSLVNTPQYHWGKVHKLRTLPTVKKYIPECTNLIPIKVKSVELDVRIAHTYDLEVASIHEFVCEGILVSNSAGMRQGSSEDELFSTAKDNLWQQDKNGNWRIDSTRDALRMANHTRVFHRKPTLEETIKAVRKQYYSGEGAIQYAPEAILRSNIDLFPNGEVREEFSQAYLHNQGKEWLQNHYPEMSEREINHRLGRYGLNPCGEILGADFHCNLSEIHLNQIDPSNYQDQDDAFKAGALSVATLLNHHFPVERYRYSREIDPIVGVSFTGLFDFFVHAFGVEWLQWWAQGRPNSTVGIAFKQSEAEYLNRWRESVHQTVWDYCDRHQLHRPNRCTTIQPSGTKSLLTGASPGWHPPKSQRFIRRITFRKNDPVALACFDYGYSIVPSQSDKDENGHLLHDAFDPRCTEWLVEIPTEVSWANLPGADEIEIGKFSAMAQFDFYMQVQKHYTTHNTSATVELRESEIEPLGQVLYEAIKNDEGYISAALLARFDDHQTFPRLPFEPIDKETYKKLTQEVIERRKIADFHQALTNYDSGYLTEAGPAGCDSDKCLLPEQTPDS